MRTYKRTKMLAESIYSQLGKRSVLFAFDTVCLETREEHSTLWEGV